MKKSTFQQKFRGTPKECSRNTIIPRNAGRAKLCTAFLFVPSLPSSLFSFYLLLSPFQLADLLSRVFFRTIPRCTISRSRRFCYVRLPRRCYIITLLFSFAFLFNRSARIPHRFSLHSTFSSSSSFSLFLFLFRFYN